jgi:hypothetical protein
MKTTLKKLNQTLGVMIDLGGFASADLADVARLVEDCGYSCLWTGENLAGRDPFVTAARLLSLTTSLTVGISVANIWKREPLTMINAARALSEFYEGRFLLGVGVSHQWLLNRYQLPSGKPLTAMRNYLAKMKSALYIDPAPAVQPPVLVGALLPKMVKLAATETEGVFLNLGVPTHTARTRQLIGRISGWGCAVTSSGRKTASRRMLPYGSTSRHTHDSRITAPTSGVSDTLTRISKITAATGFSMTRSPGATKAFCNASRVISMRGPIMWP